MTARITLGNVSLEVQAEGTGPPLLLVHGFPLDHRMWKHQVAEFAADHFVIAPDLRGFGQSDPIGDSIVSMSTFADDLAALLDRLSVDQPITMCGLSMGGYIALEFAHRHSARLRRLVFCDTKAAADDDEAVRARLATAAQVLAEGNRDLVEVMTQKLFSPHTLEKNPSVVEETVLAMTQTTDATISAALCGMAQRRDFTAHLGQLAVPTLLIVGADDSITPPGLMQDMQDRIPDSRLVSIARAGHLAPLEQPAAANRAIREFCTIS